MNEKQFQQRLNDQSWVFLRSEEDFRKVAHKIAFASVTSPEGLQPPESFPCLAKHLVIDDQIFFVFLGEEEAVAFLRAAGTVDKLQGDAPDRQGQEGWNKQMTALAMSIVKVLIDAKLVSHDMFEIHNTKAQSWIEEEVQEYKSLGKDPATASFLRKVFDL